MSNLILALFILLVPLTGYGQTNEQLLRDGLISPNLYNVLNKNRAYTTESRINLITDLCRKGKLGPSDCDQRRPADWTYR
jgi:hypothetical protein